VSEYTHDSSLVFEVGSRLCALALTHVRETMRPLPVMPLPGTLPPVLGVSIVRGAPTPVIDAGRLVGERSSCPTRYITLVYADRHVALSVDAVLGVRGLAANALHEYSPLLRDADRDLVRGIGMLDERLLVVLDGMRVVPETAWAALSEWNPAQ